MYNCLLDCKLLCTVYTFKKTLKIVKIINKIYSSLTTAIQFDEVLIAK